MNILKKAVACLAAATVMTSMAVTASAEYSVSGDASSDDLYYITLGGFSDNLMTSISAGTECQDLAFFWILSLLTSRVRYWIHVTITYVRCSRRRIAAEVCGLLTKTEKPLNIYN